jgi:hypothetical protein
VRLVDGLRRLGFRKWYERELMKSHAHLTLTFLCMVGLIGAFDAAMQFRNLPDQLIDAVAILSSGAIGIWALRRYLFLLMHAEHVANQADCPQCGVYARFRLVEGRGDTATGVKVCCRDCSHQWSIAD